jgi:predicted phosphodiesterase
MRIGLISDVHGNLPALEAVLEDMPDVDDIVCAGDLVGYNPWPAECVERIREVATVTVQGNHDRTVDTPQRYDRNKMARAGLELAKEQLNDEQHRWLSELPPRTEFANGRYRLVHSHPDPEELGTYVRPRDFTRMRPYLDDHDGIVLGHTHVQHQAKVDDRLIVNPGSVGQPRDNAPDAAYAVLDVDSSTVDMHRVEYDIDRVISRIEELDLPKKTGIRLLDGS